MTNVIYQYRMPHGNWQTIAISQDPPNLVSIKLEQYQNAYKTDVRAVDSDGRLLDSR